MGGVPVSSSAVQSVPLTMDGNLLLHRVTTVRETIGGVQRRQSTFPVERKTAAFPPGVNCNAGSSPTPDTLLNGELPLVDL